MAAQCRSSKCTVERKGLRRELDSWRNKLLHCVGFESILEGVCGPFLLRDLNIFNNCEPVEMGDWSLEATCSFCNLLINDHVMVATSPLPSPSDATPSPSDATPIHAPVISESSLSAHRFLHSVFHETELEITGDTTIPQVAQELMRRMVKQFAIEYASKTHLTTSSPTGLKRSDLEIPLDLTVARNQENQEEEPTPVGGVLDLSKRNSDSSAISSPANHKSSGSTFPADMDEPQPEAEDFGTSSRWRCSALEAVLSSCCPAHRALLQQVLRFAHQQHHLSLAYRDVHRRPVPPPGPLCCHLVAKPLDATASPHHSAFPFIGCRSATGAPSGVRGCCCVQRCRLPAVCICLNSLHCLSCQSLGHVCSSTASSLCPASSLYPLASVCCPHPKPRPCTSCCPERTSLTSLTNAPQGGGRECPVLKREQSRSPSPPPLSPMPSDMQQEEERPPCLHPHQEECPIETPGEGQQAAGSSIGLQDLVERFSQKLKTIRPQEKDLNSGLVSHNLEKTNQIVAESQNLDKTNQIVAESQVNTHLSDIINTVLRTGSGNDYSLSDMLHRHESNGKQSPQTRSRRRQEAKAAMTTDKPSTRRHIVLVKRDLARLDESLGRKRLLLVRSQTATPEPTPVMEEKAGVERVKEIREAGLEEMVLGVAEKVEREAGLEEKVLGVVEREAGVEEKVLGVVEREAGVVEREAGVVEREAGVVEKVEREAGVEEKVLGVAEKVEILVNEGASQTARGEEGRRVTGDQVETLRVSDREVKEIKEEPTVKCDNQGLLDTSTTQQVYHLQENPIGRVMSCQESRRRKRREMEKEMGETLGSTHDVSSVSDRISTPQTSGRTRSSRSPPQPGETSGIGNSREANKMSSKEVWSMSVEEVVKSFKEAGRSRRKIIPPQRFASYVTEPRKMYFAACFSESIFSAQRTTVDQPQAPLHTPTTTHIASVADTATNLATTKDDLHLGSSIEIGRGACRTKARGQSSVSRSQGQVTPVTANSSQKQSPSKHLFQNRGDVMEAAGGPYRCLRSSPVKPCRSGSQSTRPPGEVFTEPLTEQLTEPLSQPMYTGPKPHLRCTPQYSSPIKLMFVTAVVGENGVRYTLKPAASGTNWQGETFDPCEESSWAGTPEKTYSPHENSCSKPIPNNSPKTTSNPTTSPKTTPGSSPRTTSNPPTSPKTTPGSSPKTTPGSSPKTTPGSSPKTTPRSNPKITPRSSPKNNFKISCLKSPSNCTPSLCSSKSNHSPKTNSPLKTMSPVKTRSPFNTKSLKTNTLNKTTSPVKTNSPLKTRSPPKDGLPSSPKLCASRGEGGSPPKNSPLSMNASPPIHESTPLKRRPGRPKKLGPQLEKKAKRPIGRPPKQKGVDQSEGSRKDGRDQSSCSSVDWIGPARPGYQGTNLPNRNLMITVVYGRSRRTKRTVSEDAAHLQVTQQQGDAQSQPRNYRANPEKRSFPATIKEQMEDFILPVKERKFIPNALHTSKSNIKYQKLKHVSAMRRPGRPAKVKISGISVTVTTVSPRQRKIHMNRTDSVRKSIETHHRKKALLPKPCLSKEPMTISAPLSEDVAQTHETEELKDSEFKPQNQTTSPLAVRHSVRVRKPSVYLLHSVATSSSRSRSHSTALLRRSRQLLLSKASSEGSQRRRLEEAATQKELHTLGPKVQHSGREDGSEGQRMMCEELQQVAEMSVESIFLPSDSEALRWWPVSSDQESLNEELARRINLMSHSWISSTTVPHTTRSGTAKQRLNGLSSWMPSEASAVRLLFDRCCSVEKLASWFMQTTETQSLGIVKKTSSRNPYELLHYACSTTRGSVCPSPQADRLRKHVKKFAKAVPKSPAQLHLAQKTLRHGKLNAKRCLFTPRLMPDLPHQSTPWRTGLVLGAYRTTLLRVKDKFLPRSARMNRANQLRYSQAVWTRRRQVAAAGSELGQVRPSAQTRKELPEPPEHHHNPLAISSPETLTTLVGPTQQGATKQMRLRSKAWSPETLQECRVFLKKINSPDTESVAEEWGVCTVELDEIDCTNGSRQEEEPGKMGRKKRTRKVLLEESSCLEQLETENQEQDQARNRRSKRKSPRNTMRQSSPSPKVMRQSRGKGLTGPRWRDFVLGT